MTDEEFQRFIHPITHEAMRKNEQIEKLFNVGTYQQWYYEQSSQKLTFSNGGKVIVEADFQVVGSFSTSSESWMWSWHNESIEEAAKREIYKVKEFCQQLDIRKGVEGYWHADEYDPWEMTALALHVLGYQGSYRCSEGGVDGFFVVYENMHFI